MVSPFARPVVIDVTKNLSVSYDPLLCRWSVCSFIIYTKIVKVKENIFCRLKSFDFHCQSSLIFKFLYFFFSIFWLNSTLSSVITWKSAYLTGASLWWVRKSGWRTRCGEKYLGYNCLQVYLFNRNSSCVFSLEIFSDFHGIFFTWELLRFSCD